MGGSLKDSQYPIAHIGVYARARLFVQRPRVAIKVIEVRTEDTGLVPVEHNQQRRFDAIYVESTAKANVNCAQNIAEVNHVIVETPGSAYEISPVTQFLHQRMNLR